MCALPWNLDFQTRPRTWIFGNRLGIPVLAFNTMIGQNRSGAQPASSSSTRFAHPALYGHHGWVGGLQPRHHQKMWLRRNSTLKFPPRTSWSLTQCGRYSSWRTRDWRPSSRPWRNLLSLSVLARKSRMNPKLRHCHEKSQHVHQFRPLTKLSNRNAMEMRTVQCS